MKNVIVFGARHGSVVIDCIDTKEGCFKKKLSYFGVEEHEIYGGIIARLKDLEKEFFGSKYQCKNRKHIELLST